LSFFRLEYFLKMVYVRCSSSLLCHFSYLKSIWSILFHFEFHGFRVKEMAGSLNITDILNKYPYQVSGGQKQRCACARAIINKLKLILADEPTGALDSHSSQMLLSTMQSINEQLGATILMVTHDAFSASYANRILFLRDGVIFTEILKGNNSRRAFFEKVLDVQTAMRGN